MNPWLLLIPIAIVVSATIANKESRATSKTIKDSSQTFDGPEITRQLARKWGKIFGVSPSWIISQAYVESRYQPHAVNARSKATGILQILLVRAKDLIKWLSRSRWRRHPEVLKIMTLWKGNRSDLHHPELNIMLAAFDLRYLRHKFGNDHDLVAAAYNQGEGRIARRLDAGLPMPPRAIEYVNRVKQAKQMGHV